MESLFGEYEFNPEYRTKILLGPILSLPKPGDLLKFSISHQV